MSSFKLSGCKVTVVNINGSIALRYTINSKRQTLYIGLSYTDNNLNIAIAKAWEVHNDIIFNRYDGNNDKYKIGFIRKKNQKFSQELTLKEAWEFYKNVKSDIANSTKIKKWFVLEKLPQDYLELPINKINILVDFLLNKYSKTTVDTTLRILSSAINLSIDYGKYEGKNLLPKIIESLNVKKQKVIKSFSDSEISAILNAFKNDTYLNPKSRYKHSFYYNFVLFRFLTGCRPSEAIALTWNDIIDYESKKWIKFDKRYSGGELLTGTKNGINCRFFPVNSELFDLLEIIERKPATKLIFSNFNGSYINIENFGRRIWKPILTKLIKDGLVKEYLPFYDIRHTFATKLCRSGKVDLKTISSIIGNSVETLISNYLAVDESLELPKLFDFDK
jgi:integrase